MIPGKSKAETEARAHHLVSQLALIGLKVTFQKSTNTALQMLTYVGHIQNLKAHMIEPIPEKNEIAMEQDIKV